MLLGYVRAVRQWVVGAWCALVRALRVFFIGEHATDTELAQQRPQQPQEEATQLPCSKTAANRALFMAYAAYFACEWLGSTDYIQSQTRASLTETLEDPELQQLLADEESGEDGVFDLVWGPACYQAVMSAVADNTMFVCEKRQKGARARQTCVLYVSIAGTHPLSAFNWFLDLSVVRAVPWPYAQRADCFFSVVQQTAASPPATPRRTGEDQSDLRLSSGTLLGLKTLLALRDPATQQSLVEYLAARAAACKERGERLSVVVVGHSLGGALAGAMALYLHDNVSVWDTHGIARISCVSFAGPTIGNKLLARYYDACLGSRTRRIANVYDIVPLAWDSAYMPQMFRVYEPQLPTPAPLRMVIQVLINTVGPKHYAHVRDDQKFFRGTPPQRDHDWVVEVMAQHSKSYFTHFDMNALAPLIAEHAPLFREPFCDGNFSAASLKTFANMVSDSVSLAIKRMSGKAE